MRISITLLLLLSVLCSAIAQSQAPKYSRVKIDLNDKTLGQLAQVGVDVYHGQYAKGKFLITDLANWEIRDVREAGFKVEIQIEDVQAHYQDQLTSDRQSLECSLEGYHYQVPENFRLGTMGGYHTFSEMEEALDAMAIAYPGLVTVKRQTGNLTDDGHPIYWLKISDNPDVDENEPEILYTALHHAREPLSLSQMLYFMWHLLENYGKDQEITYLLDNTELYFMPCLNPDGYIYNEMTNPNGGGMWRKNKRDNDEDGIFDEQRDGVDLNRNYGYQWAFNNEGSSSSPGSNVYRGPWEFSEPEVEAIKTFAFEHNFQFILNYHSYANCLLIPWGYVDERNPDSTYYAGFAEALTKENHYKIGNTYQSLGYTANGTAIDWMYSETGAYTFTPEMGFDSDGFWPATDKIIPYCKSAVHQNLTAARLAHPYADLTETSDSYLSSTESALVIEMKRYGIGGSNFIVEVEPLDSRVSMNLDANYVNLGIFEEKTITYPFNLLTVPQYGEELPFVLHLNNGHATITDTIVKIYAGKDIFLNDKGVSLESWDIDKESNWGISSMDYFSAPTSIADSPWGVYEESSFNILALAEKIDLREVTDAVLKYRAKWEIEELIDYAMVQVSTDGENWESLCGSFSKPGSVFQTFEEPIYDGVQSKWIKEEIDLSTYIGSELSLRFVLVSDNFLSLDGIYLDDIEVIIYNEINTSVVTLSEEDFTFAQYPNPASGSTWFDYQTNVQDRTDSHLMITNSLGQIVGRKQILRGEKLELNLESYPSGWYSATLISGNQVRAVSRFLVQ